MPKRRTEARGETQLEKHAAALRVELLLKERARLLREIEKKRRLMAHTEAEALRLTDEGLARMLPLIERERSLTAQLQALFDELLREGRLAARARKELARLRALLAIHGVLPLFDDDEPEPEPSERDAGESAPWEAPPRHARPPRGASSTQPELASAPQTGQQRRSLREIFRNLARLVHPDQARQDSDRERRTEVMKQATRAYEDGDLARLIEIESAWQSESQLGEGDPEARAQELERLNRELLDQLRELTAQLRDRKRALRQARESVADDAELALAARELDQIEAIAVWLRRFRDGQCSISELKQAFPRPR